MLLTSRKTAITACSRKVNRLRGDSIQHRETTLESRGLVCGAMQPRPFAWRSQGFLPEPSCRQLRVRISACDSLPAVCALLRLTPSRLADFQLRSALRSSLQARPVSVARVQKFAAQAASRSNVPVRIVVPGLHLQFGEQLKCVGEDAALGNWYVAPLHRQPALWLDKGVSCKPYVSAILQV